ncbi:MAG: hypothetical protein V4659_07585 [Pseudomonadota bacterium]
MSVRNPWLIAGGCLSALAALLHLAVIAGGPDWYRFFGAGEAMAQGAARGDWMPPVLTLAISAVLAIWAAYAFAGVGLIRRLPLMRPALIAITAIYLLRGFAIVPVAMQDSPRTFDIWSSLIVLVYGLVYAIGTATAWPSLKGKTA